MIISFTNFCLAVNVGFSGMAFSEAPSVLSYHHKFSAVERVICHCRDLFYPQSILNSLIQSLGPPKSYEIVDSTYQCPHLQVQSQFPRHLQVVHINDRREFGNIFPLLS